MKLVVKELRSDSAEVVSSYERSYQGGETVSEFKRRLAEKGVRGYGKDSFGTSCGFHSIYLQKKRVLLKKVLVFLFFVFMQIKAKNIHLFCRAAGRTEVNF